MKEGKMVLISTLVVIGFIMIFLLIGAIWLLSMDSDPRSTALSDEGSEAILPISFIEVDLSDYTDIDISFESTDEINVYIQEKGTFDPLGINDQNRLYEEKNILSDDFQILLTNDDDYSLIFHNPNASAVTVTYEIWEAI